MYGPKGRRGGENGTPPSRNRLKIGGEEGKSSPTEREEKQEDSSATRTTEADSSSDSETEHEAYADQDKENGQVWEIPLEGVNLSDREEKQDRAMLPQIQQAIDIMLANTTANQTAANTGPELIGTPSDAAISRSEVEPMSGKGASQALGGGKDAIPRIA